MPPSSTASCPGELGKVAPVDDRYRCEAKAACVRACPYDVFAIRPLTEADRQGLSLRGRIKSWA